MRMAALLMAMIALLGSPQGEGTVSETTWETVAVQVLEETPETAARTLLDWAGSGQTIPEEDVVLALLEEMEAEPAASAVAFAAVLDRADSPFPHGLFGSRHRRLSSPPAARRTRYSAP